mgnify:CR=1 FL=1
MPSSAKCVIVSVTNDLATDNRVHRTCTVLQELGYEVLLVGRKLPGSLPLERPYATKRMRLLFRKGPLFYAEYNLRLFFVLLVARASLFVANDLDTLLPNYVVARLRGKQLVYDTHEFYTEVPELLARPRVRAVWLVIERWIFPKVEHVMTVNRSIASAYSERYQQRKGDAIAVVRNIPMRRDLGPQPTRAELGLPEGVKLLVMQGAGINIERGAEEAVLAMEELPDHLLLVIGGGDAWPVLERMVVEHGLQERVRLLGKMPYDRMMAFTRHAHVGLTLDKDSNLNYRFSLPNKLFDYLHAGVPVLATDLPEVAAIVREFDCGLVIPSPAPSIIAVAVKRMTADPHQHEPLRQRAIFAARSLDGEREKEVLKAFLANLA